MTNGGIRRELLFLLLVVAVWGGLLGYRLILDPVVGIANNADFERLLCPAGLEYPEGLGWSEKYFYWIQSEFELGPSGEDCPVYVSSAMVTVRAALALGRALRPGSPTFDLRLLGLVNSLVMIVAVAVLVGVIRHLQPSVRVVFFCLLTLVFADIGYAVYLNSFYGEPASLQYFLLTAGLFLSVVAVARRTGERAWSPRPLQAALIALFLLANALFALSKPQNYVLCLFVPVLVAPLVVWVRNWWSRALLALGVLVVITVSLLPLRNTDPVFTRMQIYDIVFFDVVAHSPNPRADLAELGLPEEFERYVGTEAWEPGSPILEAEFGERLDRVTYGVLGRFYLAHPAALISDLRRAARLVLDVRVQGKFGHFEPGAGRAGGAQSDDFAVWSELRENAFPRSLWFLVLFAVANIAVIAVKWRRFDRSVFDLGISGLHAWVVAVGAAAFVTTALAEGSLVARHFFLVSVAFDACLLLLAMYGVGWLARRPERQRTTPSPSARA